MAGINAAQVYLPSPDQSAATGAVNVAAVGVTAPTDARTALTGGWESGGYIDENGLGLSLNKSFTNIKDWSQSTVRKALTDFDGQLTCSFLQVDEFAAKRLFGAGNVTAKAATSDAGNQLAITIGADVPPVEAWCFNMKDGNRRVRVFAPQAQVTELGEVSFVPGAGNVWPATISCYPDGNGKSLYVFYDDGEVVSA